MSFIDSLSENLSIRIAICIPAREQMHTATAYCLWQLCSLLSTEGISSKLFVSPGTLIANQRHELVLSAQEWQASHVLFIDSDIEFAASDVLELLKHNKPVMAACYSKRVEPFINTAWYEIDNWNSWVRITDDDTGIRKIDAVALGFCLIDISIFDSIELPWFQLGFYGRQYTGEDIEFCRKLKDCNIDVFLDVDVSKRLKHLGTFGFTVVHDDLIN